MAGTDESKRDGADRISGFKFGKRGRSPASASKLLSYDINTDYVNQFKLTREEEYEELD